jgi:hypothetical protein
MNTLSNFFERKVREALRTRKLTFCNHRAWFVGRSHYQKVVFQLPSVLRDDFLSIFVYFNRFKVPNEFYPFVREDLNTVISLFSLIFFALSMRSNCPATSKGEGGPSVIHPRYSDQYLSSFEVL